MADEVFNPFMFAVVFVLISAFLIGFSNNIYNSNAMANNEVLENYDVIGGISYAFLNPVAGQNISTIYEYGHIGGQKTWIDDGVGLAGDESNDYPHPGTKPSPSSGTFYESSATETGAINIWLVRNNTGYNDPGRTFYDHYGRPTGAKYQDFIYIQQGYKYGWFHNHKDYKVTVVPYSLIVKEFDPELNLSVIDMNLRHNVTLFVQTYGSLNFTTSLYLNKNVSIALGHQWGTDMKASKSMWTILGQLLTLHLPGVHVFIQFLIAAPFWTAVSYIAMVIVRSFIPFLGG